LTAFAGQETYGKENKKQVAIHFNNLKPPNEANTNFLFFANTI